MAWVSEAHDAAGGVARQLIDELAREGRFIDDGAFTLDPSKAREKLRAYQLVNAHAYILLLVESAWIAKASAIDLSCGRVSVAEFMGVSLTRSQLENVFTSVFLDTAALTDAALAAARIQQMFGIAANAALSLGPERIEIENVDAEGRLNRMTITSDGSYACETIGEGPRGRTRFVVTSARGDDRQEREVALIRERCCYASFAVHLYGQRMSHGPRRAMFGLRTERILLGRQTIGLAGRRPEPEPGKLLLVTRGVLSETITLEDAYRGFVAVVDVDLRKDLSQRGVLRGAAFDEVMRAVMWADKVV
jgi:hypothetical protein